MLLGEEELKKLTKTQRLYGEHVDPRMWKFMDYQNVLKLKIRLAGERINDLNSVGYMGRDSYNIEQCMKSIKLCREMLEELEG